MAKRGKSGIQYAKDLAAEYAYVVVLVCVLAVIVGSAAYTQRIREQTAIIEAAAQAPEVSEEKKAAALATEAIKTTPLPTIAPLTVRVSLLEEKHVWPVEGDVIRHFDLQEHVFWEALNTWQVHAGTDIAGAEGQSVLCAGEGVVTAVTRDTLWGCSVEVMQEDGRLLIYRGLALCDVEMEQKLVSGQKIGTLLERIPCEAELGAHLHLEVMRGGAAQDPLAMLPER